ncbi:hypothetical protein [Streptomyces sp. DG1A-41]|uniref:protein kinase domain-containing protein n=1 Tax=Streptomyces sp. DG1A-41 TaxID=3125779 RepID=UPI0030D26533
MRELAAGLAEALRDIHRAGVVHRDLKPGDAMLAEDGPRVIDFGISRAAESAACDALTQTGRVMGTPPFMPRSGSPHPRTSARPPTSSPSARSAPARPPAAARSTARAPTRRPSASSRASRTSPASRPNCSPSSAPAWRSTESPAPRRTTCSSCSARTHLPVPPRPAPSGTPLAGHPTGRGRADAMAGRGRHRPGRGPAPPAEPDAERSRDPRPRYGATPAERNEPSGDPAGTPPLEPERLASAASTVCSSRRRWSPYAPRSSPAPSL